MQYVAKCGLSYSSDDLKAKTNAKVITVTMKTNKPFLGYEEPVTPPKECDPKCLNRRRTGRIMQYNGKADFHIVTVWRCKFHRKEA
ncbi:MAG TPA: hypothetical protein DCZ10_16035 [Pelotomaculum sp.]|nr:hypothetical protein [Pelotomaculum sp.]